ncbi:MAG: ComEA family DNA-binding protein [Planctomycetota bacterium]
MIMMMVESTPGQSQKTSLPPQFAAGAAATVAVVEGQRPSIEEPADSPRDDAAVVSAALNEANAERPARWSIDARLVPFVLLSIAFAVVMITAVRLPAVKSDVHAPGRNTLDENAMRLRSLLPDMRVDINKDPAAVLEVLPGIGPTLAQRIADDRASNGPFSSLADLQRVHGIGPKTIESLEGWLTFSQPSDTP